MSSKFEVKNKVIKEYVDICLTAIFNNVIDKVKIFDAQEAKVFGKNLVKNLCEESTILITLDNMKDSTLFLSELANYIEDQSNIATKLLTEENADVFEVDKTIAQEIEDAISSDRTIDDLTAVIADRVISAVRDFTQANAEDKIKIKDIMNNTKDTAEGIEPTGDDDLDASISESLMKIQESKLDAIYAQRKTTVFEQLVRNMSKSIIMNESLKETFMEDSKLNVDKIVDKSKVVYGVLEMVNTLHLKEVDNKFIEETLSF